MKSQIDRREFIQRIGGTALGAASASLLLQLSPNSNSTASISQQNDMKLERWLLETGRHSLDKDLYTTVARNL